LFAVRTPVCYYLGMLFTFIMKNKTFIPKLLLLPACFALFGHPFANGKDAKQNDLERELQTVIAQYMATVGIAVMDLETKEITTVNDNRHYPMQSVYKFPLAICILNMADHHILSLDSVIHVKKASLDQKTWSPLVDKYPNQDVDITIAELLNYTVSKSDNNACDILFTVAGGTMVVNKYIHHNGIENIAIVATEAEMHTSNWQVQYTNWCQPSAMQEIICLFFEGKLLSTASNDFLMNLMTESENSEKRIKGLLPPGTIVAHKTGTSGTNKHGITAATNDVGIITLPNGHHLAIVVYVSDYTGGTNKGEHIIAAVAKCAWDHYTAKKINAK